MKYESNIYINQLKFLLFKFWSFLLSELKDFPCFKHFIF
jgi:hypothetical protein